MHNTLKLPIHDLFKLNKVEEVVRKMDRQFFKNIFSKSEYLLKKLKYG